MRRSLTTIVLTTGLVSGVIGGCYLRPAPAPGFRFSCQETSDCQALDCSGTTISLEKAATLIEGCDSLEVKADPTLGVAQRQTCVAGLCEYPCDLLTAATDCPASEGMFFCFNGVCASRCGTDDFNKYKFESNDDFCTAPQTCVPLDESGIDPVLFDSLGGGGGQGGGNNNNNSSNDLIEGEGFCGLRCDAAGAPACPPGQYCTGALCLPGCDEPTATPCAAGSQCVAFGGFSSCLVSCEGGDASPCEEGEICVAGFNVCQPTCLGADAVDCPENFECDVDLAICLPVGGDENTGGDSTT